MTTKRESSVQPCVVRGAHYWPDRAGASARSGAANAVSAAATSAHGGRGASSVTARRGTRRLAACLVGCLLATVVVVRGAAAQARATSESAATSDTSTASEPSPWTFQVIPFLWLPEVQGKIATRGLAANVDVDFGKLFDLLGNGDLFAAGGHFEARYDRLSLFVDAFGGTVRPTNNVAVGPTQRPGTADLTVNFTFVEFGPAYRVLDWPRGGEGRPITVDLLTGGRFMYFYQSIDVQGSGGLFQRSANATSSWVDPFVGGRFTVPLVGDLDCIFRGDIGGFGAGSQLAWNVIGGFQYLLPWEPWGARTSLIAVYKAFDFDYETASGPKQIVANLDMRGPAFGLGFEF